jgi:membrane protease YdiL (CAAX protease family)
MKTQELTSTNNTQAFSIPVKDQYTLWRILGIWLAGGAPIWILSWLVAPVIMPRSPFHPAITYWLLMIAGMAWQFIFSLAIIYRELGTLRWSAIYERTWLRLPLDPKTGQPNPRLFWWLIPIIIIYALIGLSLAQYLDAPVGWLFPNLHPAAYQDTSQLAALDLKGQWWLLGIAVTSAFFNYFLGEEFLFRGVLLPKMEGAFGKYDWLANAVLFGMYHLHKPWGILTNIVQTIVLTLPARRFRSSLMSIAVHGTEGLLMLITILAIILGAAPG